MTHRRGRGEGSIYQRADGYWVGQVYAGFHPNGRRRAIRVVRARRDDAVRAFDELRRQVADGYVPDRTSTLATFLDFWLDEVAAGNVSEGSLAEYRKRVKRVPPELGKVKLHKLTTAHIQRWANTLADTYSAKTARTTVETIRSALRWANHAGMVARNPAEGAKVRSVPTAKVDDTLTADEAKAVMMAATGDMAGITFLGLTYGMRIGEILDLLWSDVDFEGGTLTVRKSKTAAGVRTLPLTDDAIEVLRDHRRQKPGIAGYVFASSTGGRRSPQRTRDAWNDVLRAAGIKHKCSACDTDKTCSTAVRRFHSSRHTAATLMLERGVELETVSAILGHANIGITADIYARVRADAKRRALSTGGVPR